MAMSGVPVDQLKTVAAIQYLVVSNSSPLPITAPYVPIHLYALARKLVEKLVDENCC